jgi:hypothetical protein
MHIFSGLYLETIAILISILSSTIKKNLGVVLNIQLAVDTNNYCASNYQKSLPSIEILPELKMTPAFIFA